MCGDAALIPTLAASSPRLAGYGAYGIGAGARLGAQALDRLGPLANLPYRPVAKGAYQLSAWPTTRHRDRTSA